MAESAVTFLVRKLSNLVEDESKLLDGARGDLLFIQYKLERMRAVLKAAAAMEDSDPEFQAWVKLVKDVANDTNDVIDNFTLCLPRRDQHGFTKDLSCRIYHQMKNVHQIESKIRAIKGRVIEIAQRSQRYNYKLYAQSFIGGPRPPAHQCYRRIIREATQPDIVPPSIFPESLDEFATLGSGDTPRSSPCLVGEPSASHGVDQWYPTSITGASGVTQIGLDNSRDSGFNTKSTPKRRRVDTPD